MWFIQQNEHQTVWVLFLLKALWHCCYFHNDLLKQKGTTVPVVSIVSVPKCKFQSTNKNSLFCGKNVQAKNYSQKITLINEHVFEFSMVMINSQRGKGMQN